MRMPCCWLLMALTTLLTASEAPLGGKDFYPSPERPVGFRGDGRGWFPGATPVTTFAEGTPVEKTEPNPPHRDRTIIAAADDKKVNIVWKTAMPGWANGQPVVAGDRVFTLAEPHSLVCVDAHDGEILWTRSENPWEVAGVEPKLAERLLYLAEIALLLNDLYKSQTAPRPGAWNAEQLKQLVDDLEKSVAPRLLEALAKLDPGVDHASAAQTTIAGWRTYLADMASKTNPKNSDMARWEKFIENRMKELDQTPVKYDLPWGNMIGNCMAAPVTDGRYIYASFAQGVTACYDYSGKRIWARFIPPSKSRTPLQSPLLGHGVYVDMHGGSDKLYGLDAATGRPLWEAPTTGAYAFPRQGGYYVGGHTIVELSAADGTEVPVIVTSLCNVIRLADGKVLGPLPFDGGASGGPTMVAVGDIVYKSSCGDNYGTPVVAFRLRLEDPDTLRVEKVWETGDKGCPGYHGQVATDRFLIMSGRQGGVIDATTGTVLAKGDRQWLGRGAPLSMTLTATGLIIAEDGSKNWGKRRPDGSVSLTLRMIDLSDPGKPRPITDRNLLAETAMPAMPIHERWAPEWLGKDHFISNWAGRPGHLLHTDTGVFPSGNRLFIRTVPALICVGDPGVDYDWNPRSRPPGIVSDRK